MCAIHVAEHSVDDIDEIVFEAFVLLVFLVERQVAFALFPHDAVNDGNHGLSHRLLVEIAHHQGMVPL